MKKMEEKVNADARRAEQSCGTKACHSGKPVHKPETTSATESVKKACRAAKCEK